MGRKDSGRPRGRMSSYAYFVQTCREEHKKKHPGESVVFTEFTKKCAEKWKKMEPKDKKTFDEMAEKDKARYQREMANYVPPKGAQGKKRRKTKDPNAPKRALSAFFFFCGEERSKVKEQNASLSIGEIAKELGKRWETCKEKGRFEAMAKKDKERYERENAVYKGKACGGSPAKKAKPAEEVEEEDEEEEEEDDDEEEEDEEEDDS